MLNRHENNFRGVIPLVKYGVKHRRRTNYFYDNAFPWLRLLSANVGPYSAKISA